MLFLSKQLFSQHHSTNKKSCFHWFMVPSLSYLKFLCNTGCFHASRVLFVCSQIVKLHMFMSHTVALLHPLVTFTFTLPFPPQIDLGTDAWNFILTYKFWLYGLYILIKETLTSNICEHEILFHLFKISCIDTTHTHIYYIYIHIYIHTHTENGTMYNYICTHLYPNMHIYVYISIYIYGYGLICNLIWYYFLIFSSWLLLV